MGVIWDSVDVKRDLAADLARTTQLLCDWSIEADEDADDSEERWPEWPGSEPSLQRALVAVEKFVFWTGIAARKLMEAEKLSDDFEEMRFRVRTFPHTPGHFPWRWSAVAWLELDKYYDLDAPKSADLGPRAICSQLIHSFVFVPILSDDQRSLTGFYFNSDRTKEKCVYEMSWTEFERFLSEIINDTINYSCRVSGTQRLILRRQAPPASR